MFLTKSSFNLASGISFVATAILTPEVSARALVARTQRTASLPREFSLVSSDPSSRSKRHIRNENRIATTASQTQKPFEFLFVPFFGSIVEYQRHCGRSEPSLVGDDVADQS